MRGAAGGVQHEFTPFGPGCEWRVMMSEGRGESDVDLLGGITDRGAGTLEDGVGGRGEMVEGEDTYSL